MHFQRFDVEEQVQGTCVDYVTVHDGASVSASAILDRTCGKIIDEFNMTTSGSSVTFYFRSDENAKLRGFDAVYVAYSERKKSSAIPQ